MNKQEPLLPIGREKIRWMMWMYDTVFYVFTWAFLYLLQPSVQHTTPFWTRFFYFAGGYAVFFGARFLLQVYKRILRYGAMPAFARELLSDMVGTALLLAVDYTADRLLPMPYLPLSFLISFSAVYTVISMVTRIAYCYFYRFAERDTTFARLVRRILELSAHVDFSSPVPGAVLQLKLESQKVDTSPINELQHIASQFAIRGEITAIVRINKGYINQTYRVETLSQSGNIHKYTLQRINTNVFPDVDALMDNYKLTTDHLHDKLLLPGHREKGSVQMVRTTKDGAAYLSHSSGCWRMLTYFDDVYSLDIPNTPEIFYHTGRAFGSFLKYMSDVDVNDVKIVIPNFHNTASRYRDLETAIAENACDRVKDVQPEIAFLRERANRFSLISDALESGKIPTRVCHNDCNLNNILFDNKTNLPVAIIDLDTVMPSSPLYDYGDSMRIGTNTATDDEKDLSKVSCDLNLYEQYARGYLEACGDILTTEELELLPYASLIITSEDGIRFLMDHINGDTYYHIYYPGQNLDRSRTQLTLLADMEKKLPDIKRILKTIYAELSLVADLDKELI